MARTMTRASFLRLSFTLGLTLTGLCFSAPSYASRTDQTDLYFYPKTKWSLIATQDSAQHPCIIQSKFNNGFIMQFGGTERWIQDLKIDFKQDVFEANKSYTVLLSVPGKQNNTLSGQAVSKNLLSVSLDGQKELYKSIRESSVLDMDVEGNDFRFYMVGFSGSAKSFEQCMAASGSKDDPKSDIVVEASPKTTPPEDTLVNEAIALEQSEKTSETTSDAIKPNFALQSTKQSVGNTTEPKSRKRLSDMLAEDIAANPEIADVNVKQEKTAAVAPNDPVDSMKASSITLPPDPMVLPLPGQAEQPVNITQQNTKSVETPKAVPVETEKTKKIDKTIASLTQEKKPMHNNSDLHRKNKELNDTIRKLKEENAALNDDLASSIREGRQEHVEISSSNWNLERANMRYQEAERQMKRMGQQLQQERARCTVEKEELEAMLFDPKVTNQKQLAELAKLNQDVKDLHKQLEEQRVRYEERIRLLEQYADNTTNIQ